MYTLNSANHPRAVLPCAVVLLLAFSGGCFVERSFPMARNDRVMTSAAQRPSSGSVRWWLAKTQPRLERFIPDRKAGTLLTADLTNRDGLPIDIYAHFGTKPTRQGTLLYNFPGILHSAQSTGPRYQRATLRAWDGFSDVWIPVDESVQLSGRLGLALRDGKPIEADCIIVMAGLYGDNTTKRSRDVAFALRSAGFHVLCLEPRGHGLTETRYPDAHPTYSVAEVSDLIAVAEWLQRKPHVRDTGLIGFSWNASLVLLAAWEDSRSREHPSVPPHLASHLRRAGRPGSHFRAGVISFSPSLRVPQLFDSMARPRDVFDDPVLNHIQRIIAGRAKLKGYPPTTSLRRLVQYELAPITRGNPEFFHDAFEYVRMIDTTDHGAPHKLESVRVPMLIVYGINDPLRQAQAVADLFVGLHNPNVAGMILPGGGHCGFGAYAPRYFYNLLIDFFDRDFGAAACARRSRQPAPTTVLAESVHIEREVQAGVVPRE